MRPAEFENLAELVSDGLLLITGQGRIVAANRRALTELSCETKPEWLQDVFSDGSQKLHEALRQWRRSSQESVAALHLDGDDVTVRLFGRLLQHADDSESVLVLLRIPNEDSGFNRFLALNDKIEELGREVSRRRLLETELREQYQHAAFGRDVGLVLAQGDGIEVTLQRCTGLLVEYLGAAFARIWTVSPSGEELVLRASAGLYTHLDGNHSRIRIGDYKIGLIAQNQQEHLTNQVVGDDRVHDQEWAKREGMVAFAGYPLIVDSRTVGVMAVFARHPLSESSLKVMGASANSIALGIERKEVEAKLAQTANVLKRANRLKDEFLAMLAHELRNPLAPLRSGLELLQLQTGENETLTVMLENVQHLNRMIDDLLDVSRITRGRIELRSDSIELIEVIDQVVRNMSPIIHGRGHTLSVRKGDPPIWLRADRVRIAQIATNLLANAVKYTPPGGHLSLDVDVDDGWARLRVRDNGIGIDSDFLPEIFELFAQAERGLARSEGGLGIGLTLVQRLVNSHGGTVSVTSDGKNKGSEFVVRLPLAEAPATVVEDAVYDLRHLPGTRILIVDDSVGSARMLQRLLEAIGAVTMEMAHSGPSAIVAAGSFQPEVVFLDVGLPGLSGFEVATRLRADEQFGNTRIIGLTGYGTNDDRRKGRDAGFDDHLVKPVGLDDLKRVLSRDQLAPDA